MTHCHTILTHLRQRGYRITPQRELIIEALVHDPDHITAEALHLRVQQHTSAVNIATVYRTLDMLVNEGLANRAALLDGQLIYTPTAHGAHLHLICRACRQSIPADQDLLASVSRNISDRYAFTADLDHITLFGICRTCQASRTAPTPKG